MSAARPCMWSERFAPPTCLLTAWSSESRIDIDWLSEFFSNEIEIVPKVSNVSQMSRRRNGIVKSRCRDNQLLKFEMISIHNFRFTFVINTTQI